jgi:7-cyano-7-deazaguanine synthase
MSNRTVVLLSGGLDSTTLLYHLMDAGMNVTALTVDYGQRHVREIEAAKGITKRLGVPLVSTYLSDALRPIFEQSKSSQVGAAPSTVPEGHYAAETMKTTIVPNRNMLLIAIAGALADSIGASTVAYAAHAGDHPIYPDCRPEFIESCAQTLLLATNVALTDPFQKMSKADIVTRGAALHVPFHETWSCYVGSDRHCGKCSTCVERREAFALTNVLDPTDYADKTDFWKSVTSSV